MKKDDIDDCFSGYCNDELRVIEPNLRSVWTLDEGLAFVRKLREATRPAGFDVALTGSVLYRGSSTKDIDVIIYALSSDRRDMFALGVALGSVGLRQVRSKEELQYGWKGAGKTDSKHVEEWVFDGKRVDLFFLQ